MDTLGDAIHNASAFVQLAPKMLAMDGQPRTYLILAQTNAELRPSGGMPGSWGTMTVTNGKVEMHEFVSGSSIPRADTPVVTLTAEERSLFTDKLGRVSQDANFTPDFPRTGEIAKALWEQNQQTTIDGVIALDPVFLQSMLAVTGGVTLDDDQVLDGTNTVRFLLSDVYAQQSVADQDAYFSMAASAAFEHIMQSMQNPASYITAICDSVDNGHLLLWSAHMDEQNLIDTTAISGGLVTDSSEPQVGVYFSDVTQSKMDWYLDRDVSVEYQKDAANGAKQYTVRITVTNTLTQDQVAGLPQYVLGDQLEGVANGQIKTALFVYAPAGGRLVDWTMSDGGEFDGVTVHDGLTVGAKTFTLGPGESYEIVCHVQSVVGVDEPVTLRQTPLAKQRRPSAVTGLRPLCGHSRNRVQRIADGRIGMSKDGKILAIRVLNGRWLWQHGADQGSIVDDGVDMILSGGTFQISLRAAVGAKVREISQQECVAARHPVHCADFIDMVLFET